MRMITLPSVYCPFPRRSNPHDAHAWTLTVDWVSRVGLVPREALLHLRGLDYHRLSAYAFPDAGLAQLALVNDWMTLFYLFDKQWDDARPDALSAEQAALMGALRGGPLAATGGSPLQTALLDARRRMLELGSDAWMERFCATVGQYFDACLWEAKNKASGTSPDVDAYVRMREKTGGVRPSFELAGAIGLVELPPAMMEEPFLERLSTMANHVICWFNDIVSLNKERQVGDVHNLVLILQRERGYSLDAAVERIVGMHDAEVRAFVELSSRPPSWGEPLDSEVERYVDVLRCWMRANVDWSLDSERYRISP